MLVKIRDFLELIKFEHTVFALPFAYVGMVLAAAGWPTLWQFLWITSAMIAARTVAMGTNRIVDRVLDAQNPRTAQRALASGRVKLSTALAGTGIALMLLVLSAYFLGPLPLRYLPVALFFLIGYTFTKRFTWLSHYILGFTDGLAPMGAWVAVRGSLFSGSDLPAWLLLVAVMLWIGGFDLIYACQDAEFDRKMNLQAIPAKFGIPAALKLSAISHTLMVFDLILLGISVPLPWPYWLGLIAISGLLVYEHGLISPSDLSRVNIAFFNINSIISAVLLISITGAIFIN